MKKLRIAFMGTPGFSVPALEELIDGPHEIICVYTQPPRPKGRGQHMQPSPIHDVASRYDIPVYTPKSLKKDAHARAEFVALDPDIAIVAAYGLILPKAILEAPRYGCLNIHASLLPRWRGASPIQHAIWKGDTETGITIMQMDEGLDTGAMIEKRAVTIRPQTTAQSLHDELSALGAAMTVKIINALAEGKAPDSEAQNDQESTYAPLLTKEDGHVDWTQNTQEIDRQIRALTPWPGVWTVNSEDKRLKILAAEPVSEEFFEPPGTVIDHAGHVSCGNGTGLRLITVQPESKKAMDAISAINGGYLMVDEVLGQ